MTSHLPTGPTPSAIAMRGKFAAAAREGWKPPPLTHFTPNWLFLYGTLMDPEMLQSILGLEALPVLVNATVTGFNLKMWGIYPALVRNSDYTVGEVKGKVYWLKSWEELEKLEAYETNAYQWGFCDLLLEDGTKVKSARTFEWAKGQAISQLDDGAFDLERFQHHFKPFILGKPPTWR